MRLIINQGLTPCPPKKGDILGKKQNPNWKPEIDGCSLPWYVIPIGAPFTWNKDNPVGWCSFYAVCATHDLCYQTCYNQTADAKPKAWCDNHFLKNMQAACDKCVAQKAWGTYRWTYANIDAKQMKENCYDRAEIYAKGVREHGDDAWNKRQKQVCQDCCCP